MSDRIRVEDIIDEKIKAELIAISTQMDKVVISLKSLIATSKQADTVLKQGAKTQEELGKTTKQTGENAKKLSDVEKEITKIEEQHYNVLTKMVAERSIENKKLEEAKQKRSEENKTLKESIALKNTEVNSIARLTAENKKLIKERNALNTATKAGQQRIKEINQQLDNNNRAIKQNTSALEQQKNNVGNYASAFKNLGSNLLAVTGLTMGLAGAKKFLQSVIGSTKTSNDDWQASLHATSNAFDVLKKSIATFNFKDLIGRMKDAAVEGRNYAEAMAELGDRLRSYGLQEAEARAETDLLREGLTDENLTIKERIDIGNKLIQSEKELLELRKTILKDISNAEIKDLASKIGLSEDELTTMLRNYNLTQKIRDEAVKYNSVLDVQTGKADKLNRKRIEMAANGTDISKMENVHIAAFKELSKEQQNVIKNTDSNTKIYATLIKKYSNSSDEELDKVVDSLKLVAEAESEYANKRRRIVKQLQILGEQQKKGEKELERVRIESLETVTKLVDSYAKEVKEIEERLLEDKKDIFAEDTQEYEAELNKRLQANYAAIQEMMRYEEMLKDYKISAINESFGLYSAIQQREIQGLEARRDREIELAGQSEKARTFIEEQYASKIADIKRKQAIADRLQAIFNISLDTAQAIIGFLARPGGLLGTKLSIAAGIIGGIQTATVLATPIPKFYKGVRDFQGGLATVGEQGFELFRTPDNKVGITPETATTMFLPKGTDVFTHQESERIVKSNSMNIDVSELIKEQRLTRKALSNKVEHHTTIDADGMKYTIKKNQQKITYIDKYIRG